MGSGDIGNKSPFLKLTKGLKQTSGLLIKRGTALGPLVPTLALIPIFLTAAVVFKEIPGLLVLFSVFSVIPLMWFLVHYSIFARSNPDLLQSEEYRIEEKRLHLMAAKGLEGPILVDELNRKSVV